MASIRKETLVDVPAGKAWEAIRNVGEAHKLAPGFIKECRMDGNARLITFGNGLVARELIVDVDDHARRLSYSARSERLEHHNASFEVFHAGNRCCRIVWIADVLPDEAAKLVGAMMEESSAIMKKTLEAA
jgi:hypothetical protein